jgi:SAM-dependent methyltransferase
MTRPITLAGFEAKFAQTDDPWHCRGSAFEALKRRRALAGLRLAGTALDVACGDGSGTLALSARALRVDALDGSEAALAAARGLLGTLDRRVCLQRARIPGELPAGRWRRILVSELVYYLSPHEIAACARALIRRVAPGGALIAVHHTVPFGDARTPPSTAVSLFHAHLSRGLERRSFRRLGPYVIARWQLPRTAG